MVKFLWWFDLFCIVDWKAQGTTYTNGAFQSMGVPQIIQHDPSSIETHGDLGIPGSRLSWGCKIWDQSTGRSLVEGRGSGLLNILTPIFFSLSMKSTTIRKLRKGLVMACHLLFVTSPMRVPWTATIIYQLSHCIKKGVLLQSSVHLSCYEFPYTKPNHDYLFDFVGHIPL